MPPTSRSRANIDEQLKSSITIDDCKCWGNNNLINPISGRAIQTPTNTLSTSWGNKLRDTCSVLNPQPQSLSQDEINRCNEKKSRRSQMTNEQILREIRQQSSQQAQPQAQPQRQSPQSSQQAQPQRQSPSSSQEALITDKELNKIKILETIYSKENCETWLSDRTKNPLRNTAVKKYGGAYSNLLLFSDFYGLLIDDNTLSINDKRIIKKLREDILFVDILNIRTYIELFIKLLEIFPTEPYKREFGNATYHATYKLESINYYMDDNIIYIKFMDLVLGEYNRNDNVYAYNYIINKYFLLFHDYINKIKKSNISDNIINTVKSKYDEKILQMQRENEERENRLRRQREERIRREERIAFIRTKKDMSPKKESIGSKEDLSLGKDGDCIETFKIIKENIEENMQEEDKKLIKSFKSFKNKMIRTCDFYNKNKSVCLKSNKKNISSLLIEYSNTKIPTNINDYGKSEDHTIDYYENLPAIYSLYLWYITNKNTTLEINIKYLYIVNSNIDLDTGEISNGQGQDAGGLSVSFINNIIAELFSLKIFTPSDDAHDKYYINPNYEMSQDFIDFLSMFDIFIGQRRDISEEEAIHTLYELIGKFLSFLLINGFGIPNELSSYIIANFLYKKSQIKDNDYLYFMLRDMPVFTKGLINLLETPDMIEHLSLEYKKEGTDVDIDITKENYIDFLYTIAKHKCTVNILNPDRNPNKDNGSKKNISKIYDSLISGIYPKVRNLLHHSNTSLSLVDILLTSEKINKEIIIELKNKLIEKMENNTNDKIQKQLGFFKNILSGEPREYDKDITKKDNETDKEYKERQINNYYDFIEKLLVFWTGLNRYADKFDYNFIIAINLTNTSLPLSHTCFQRLDLPKYETEEILYEKLKLASYNTQGYQFAGKKLKKKKTKK